MCVHCTKRRFDFLVSEWIKTVCSDQKGGRMKKEEERNGTSPASRYTNIIENNDTRPIAI